MSAVERLRIAVVTPLFPVRSEVYRGQPIYQTVLGLVRHAEVEVFCPMAVYPPLRGLQPRSYKYRRADGNYQPEGVRTHYIDYPTFPVAGRVTNGMVSGLKLLPALKRFQPEIVLAYWLYPEGYGAAWAARRLGVPCVLGSRGSDLRRPPDLLSAWLMRRTVRSGAFLLTVSEELRQRALALGVPADRVQAIPNGCRTDIFHPADRSEARRELGVGQDAEIILFVGHLIETKGVFELLEAFRRLAQQRTKLELVLIGEGSQSVLLRQMAEESRLVGRIRFEGGRPASQVARWMAASDLLCLPSHTEGYPNVIVEALSSGRPVVAANVGGIPELIDGGCGEMVEPKNVDSLVGGLEKVLNSSWEADLIARRSNRSWDDVGDETYEVCRRVYLEATGGRKGS